MSEKQKAESRKKQIAVRNLLDFQENAKMANEAVTAMLDKLAGLLAPGETVEVDSEVYELVDNFADGNTIFRPACVHRYSIRPIKR